MAMAKTHDLLFMVSLRSGVGQINLCVCRVCFAVAIHLWDETKAQ